MDESPNNYDEWKRPESSLSEKKREKKGHTVWLHLYKTLKTEK